VFYGLNVDVAVARRVEQVSQSVGVRRERPVAPGMQAELNRRFVQGELCRPGSEAALPAVGVQIALDRRYRLVCRCAGELVERSAPVAAVCARPTPKLGSSDTKMA
jgi:hypothetical protein